MFWEIGIISPWLKRGALRLDLVKNTVKIVKNSVKIVEKINAVGFLDTRPRLSLSADIRANRFLL